MKEITNIQKHIDYFSDLIDETTYVAVRMFTPRGKMVELCGDRRVLKLLTKPYPTKYLIGIDAIFPDISEIYLDDNGSGILPNLDSIDPDDFEELDMKKYVVGFYENEIRDFGKDKTHTPPISIVEFLEKHRLNESFEPTIFEDLVGYVKAKDIKSVLEAWFHFIVRLDGLYEIPDIKILTINQNPNYFNIDLDLLDILDEVFSKKPETYVSVKYEAPDEFSNGDLEIFVHDVWDDEVFRLVRIHNQC